MRPLVTLNNILIAYHFAYTYDILNGTRVSDVPYYENHITWFIDYILTF